MVNKELVIAVDNSEECLKALDFAIEHFPNGYTFHLLHIQPRLHAPSSAAEKEMIAATKKFLEDAFVSKAKSADTEAIGEVVEINGDSSKQIGEAICEHAEKVKADTLVLMRQNKSTVTRFFLGSVTRYCAVHSPTPVAIVPNTSSGWNVTIGGCKHSTVCLVRTT
ncbi:g5189 [Coccomyxa elongata]